MAIFQREPARSPDSSATSEDRRAASQGGSKVAQGARFEGNLTGATDVTVEGRVDGKLAVEGSVIVASGGEVHGLVQARMVRVSGKVVGNLVATDLVELATTAVLEGDIQATRVVIAEGAYFTGKVAMASPATVAKPSAKNT